MPTNNAVKQPVVRDTVEIRELRRVAREAEAEVTRCQAVLDRFDELLTPGEDGVNIPIVAGEPVEHEYFTGRLAEFQAIAADYREQLAAAEESLR